MIKYLLTTYIIIATAKIIHELSHALWLRYYCVKIGCIVIGNGPFIKIHNFKLSPFILGGYVEFDFDSFLSLTNIKRLIILISGTISSLVILLFLSNYYVIVKYLIIASIITNLVPIKCFENDGYLIYQYVVRSNRKRLRIR